MCIRDRIDGIIPQSFDFSTEADTIGLSACGGKKTDSISLSGEIKGLGLSLIHILNGRFTFAQQIDIRAINNLYPHNTIFYTFVPEL